MHKKMMNGVHLTSVIDRDVIIGDNTYIWHYSHVREKSVIGDNCSLGQNVYVGPGVKIGNGVRIQNNVSVYECVELHDYVFCGPSCVFTNDPTPRAKYHKGITGYKKTIVEEGATIGANATIVCGNIIGKNAMVGAGAVVTSDIPAYALFVGNPARQIGWVCECGVRLDDKYECKKCGRRYHLIDGRLEEIA